MPVSSNAKNLNDSADIGGEDVRKVFCKSVGTGISLPRAFIFARLPAGGGAKDIQVNRGINGEVTVKK